MITRIVDGRVLAAALLLAGALAPAPAPATGDGLEAVKAGLAPHVPAEALATLRRSQALPGWYELELGTRLLYVRADGKRLFAGDLIDLESGENLTRAWRELAALELIEAVGEENMIVFGSPGAARTITVFTDVDCPYCARLHGDVPTLVKAGVRVRYLLYPRAGLRSRTYDRSVSVWCADDPARAIGVAKSGGALQAKTCPNPVARHYELGRRLEIRGTPTIYLDDGTVIGGYLPPQRLLAALELEPGARAADAR